jgi:broad specificity phosphatase PhoE
MNSTISVLLIRHATTDLAGLLCGHLDPALNDAGRRQAATLIHALRSEPVRSIYSSDLLRATQTADPLARTHGVPVLHRAALREISFGEWEGLRWRELQAGWGLTAHLELSEWQPPGGESFGHFRARAAGALKEIVAEAAPGPVIVVTHLGVIRTALTLLAGLRPDSDAFGAIDYCSAHRFEVKDGTWSFDGRV